MLIRFVLIMSLIFNITIIFIFFLLVWSRGGFRSVLGRLLNRAPLVRYHYDGKNSIYDSIPLREKSTIFLGDSITEQAEWHEFLAKPFILNRGISGDNTSGVLARLDTVINNKPESIYIMLGINDLLKGESMCDVVSNYESILLKLMKSLPQCRLIVQSTLPVNNSIYNSTIINRNVHDLNTWLRGFCALHSHTYLDIYSLLVRDGQLPNEYTTDGIHLKGEPYKLWVEAILNQINKG